MTDLLFKKISLAVLLIIRRGVNINAINDKKQTALHLAAQLCNVTAVGESRKILKFIAFSFFFTF